MKKFLTAIMLIVAGVLFAGIAGTDYALALNKLRTSPFTKRPRANISPSGRKFRITAATRFTLPE